MGKKTSASELFQSSNLVLLICYTLFGTILSVESMLLGWVVWPLIPIDLGVIASWVLYLRNILDEKLRTWICAVSIIGTFFYYGTYVTSTFDLAIVMAAVIIIFTLTGNKTIITTMQITYFASMGYCIALMALEGTDFDILNSTRILMHCGMIIMIGWISKTIIDKWLQVLNRSQDEVEELTESTERLNDFLANVSHELRTPVNAVIGLSNICIDKEDNEEIRKDLVSIRSAGRKVAEQIGDILDFSEIDRDKLVRNNEDFMLSSLMHDLVSDIRDEYMTDGIELVIDINSDIPAVMNTDVAKLKKVIKALLTNGLKYTREGGVYLKMESDKQPYGVNLRLEVTDTGIGMSDEELENVYDKFYQVDSGRSRHGSGLGLGLCIVNGFVKSLGGFLTVKSTVGVGTTARVSIPVAVVNNKSCMSISNPAEHCIASFLHFDKFSNPQVREFYNSCVFNIVRGLGVQMHRVDKVENLRKLNDMVEITHLFIGEEEYLENQDYIEEIARDMEVVVVANKGLTLPPTTRCRILEKPFYCFPVVSVINAGRSDKKNDKGHMILTNIHALVVDDEPMNLIVAKSIFKRYGMEVTTVNSGPEAIQACRETLYDIIFMDHMMGGMDGVEAMKRIKQDVSGFGSNVPIVALTANAMSSAKQMFMSEGFDGFVSKPIETEELERVLKRILPKSSISYSNEALETGGDISISANEPEEPAQPLTFRGKLKAAKIDVETGLHYCAGDFSFYKTLLHQIASEAKEKIELLARYYEAKDWKNYEIIIHAVKSTTKTVGALSLSEDALALESAAKNDNEEYILENHSRVLEDFKNLRKNILNALDEKDEDEGKVVSAESSIDDEVMEFGPEPDGGTDDDEIFEFSPEEGGN